MVGFFHMAYYKCRILNLIKITTNYQFIQHYLKNSAMHRLELIIKPEAPKPAFNDSDSTFINGNGGTPLE